MTTVLRTARLSLREITEGDLDVIAAMMSDPDQMHLYPRPRTKPEALAWIETNLHLYELYGFGCWLIEDIPSGDFLGYCGIRPIAIDGSDEIEMAWHTIKHVWGQGIATEAARGCRDLAFQRFGLPRVVATIDPVNAPSLRVAQKIGMQPEKGAVLDGWSCLVYLIRRDSRHSDRSRLSLDRGTYVR